MGTQRTDQECRELGFGSHRGRLRDSERTHADECVIQRQGRLEERQCRGAGPPCSPNENMDQKSGPHNRSRCSRKFDFYRGLDEKYRAQCYTEPNSKSFECASQHPLPYRSSHYQRCWCVVETYREVWPEAIHGSYGDGELGVATTLASDCLSDDPMAPHSTQSRQGLLHAASQMSPASGSTTDRPYPPPALPPPSTAFTRMREALRPPWLDGLPPAPSIARVRQTMRKRYARLKEEGWMGGSGRREREEGMKRWREELRERLVRFRQWRPASSSGAAAAKSGSGEAGINAGSVAGQSSPSEISDVPTQRVPRSLAASDLREQGATTTTQNRLETASVASSPASPASHRAGSQSHDEPIETQRERLAKLMHEVRSGKPLARE